MSINTTEQGVASTQQTPQHQPPRTLFLPILSASQLPPSPPLLPARPRDMPIPTALTPPGSPKLISPAIHNLPTPPSSLSRAEQRSYKFDFVYGPPPRTPRPQKWQCHHCGELYLLATTRRCLQDGHYFCTRPRLEKRGRKPSRIAKETCQSSFDISGWSNYNAWRRKELRARAIKADDTLLKRLYRKGDTSLSSYDHTTDETIDDMLVNMHRDCTSSCNWVGECTRNPCVQFDRIMDEIEGVDEDMDDDLYDAEGDFRPANVRRERRATPPPPPPTTFEELFGIDLEEDKAKPAKKPYDGFADDDDDDDDEDEEEEPINELEPRHSPQRRPGFHGVSQRAGWYAPRRKSA